MDCEKFETAMLDELYDELDELTSAAVKRHVAGCARCAALLGGLRATRRVAVLPLEEPSLDLEDRILAAARNAQKVVPLRGRIARGISTAGGWAMRPQTAMAALFLLMIGSSVLLLRGRAKVPSASSVTVTEEGAPALNVDLQPASAEQRQKKELASAASGSAHGVAGPNGPAQAADGLVATNRDKDDRGEARAKLRTVAPAEGESLDVEKTKNAGPIAGAVAGRDDPNGLPPATGLSPPPPAATATAAASAATPALAAGSASGGSFNSAMTHYHGRRWAEAYSAFRALAPGNTTAELYAARSLQQISGCNAALPHFDGLANRAWGSNAGHDAALDAARCYRAVGNVAVARSWLQRLLQTNYAALAREQLQALDESDRAGGGGVTRSAAPAPAPAPTPEARPAAR